VGPGDRPLMCQSGMVLHVREWGDGDRVAVLVHGMAGDGDDWAPVAPLIAARGYRVVAPGHGRSLATPGATFEGLAASVAEAGGASPEVMLGHSMGAVVLAVGIRTEVLHPQRCTSTSPS